MNRALVLVLSTAASLGAATIVSPCALADSVSMKSPQFTAARIAERYLAVHYPAFDTIAMPPIVDDEGDVWKVSYELPPNMAGGNPVIVVEKTSWKVLRVYHEQ
uniref:YbbC/YhhH family protein n=1 Tax=Bradyrhizobium sp. (strain ORS 278) TaxID=114615 RepID=UPI0005A02A24|nr:YbbC/YhhH family protein [Bradyrhizobium sp. ORS 278]